MLRDDTIKRHVGGRYNYSDLLKADDLAAPSIIRDGFDGHGQPREYIQAQATPERIAKAGRRLIGPEVTRKTTIRYNRIEGAFEAAYNAGHISAAEKAAGERLQNAEQEFDSIKISSYGSGGGRGEGSETERRARCRQDIADARDAIRNQGLYSWIAVVAKDDLSAWEAPTPPTIKHRNAAPHRATRDRHYARCMKIALGRIADKWGLG